MNPTPPTESCVLIVEINGDEQVTDKLRQIEATRAMERCLSRALRTVEANGGNVLLSAGRRIIAYFGRCEVALVAAQDIRQRINRLPPVSNILLSMRIGLHVGPYESGKSRPADNTIEVASQVVLATGPNQIMFSRNVAEMLAQNTVDANFGIAASMIASTSGEEIFLYELPAELDMPVQKPAAKVSGMTQTSPYLPVLDGTSTDPQGVATYEEEAPRTRLMMRYQGSSFLVSETYPVLLAGREEGNDLVVMDRRASRQHARVEWRQGRYILIDSSANGTYIVDENGEQTILRHGEWVLPQTGLLGFGYPPQELDADPVIFEISLR